MKGQKLFVRPIEAADADAVRAFAAQHGGPRDTRAGLIGKLVGELYRTPPEVVAATKAIIVEGAR